MERPSSSSREVAAAWLLWLCCVAALTAGMVLLRGHLDKAHVALTYLLLVLAGSARGTRTRGVALAVLCFLCFNFFFLPPYGTLVVARPLDWLVLFTFLTVAGVAAQLLYRVRMEADEARSRADEINRLATLGAETLNVGRAEDAVAAIADVIRTTVGVRRCTIELPERGDGDAVREDEWATNAAALAAERGVAVAELRNGATRLVHEAGRDAHELRGTEDATALALPLYVGGRVVGVLHVADERGVTLNASQRRIFAALSYYAALGAERVRLVAQEEHAVALREADRLKDALIATVSHDLRTPLTTIKALAREVAAGGDDRAVVIEEEADRLNRFVANLLDMSRLNAGELPIALETVAVEDLLGAALQRVSGPVGSREIRVDLGPPEPLVVGRMDFVQALRVVANLLENADKYSPRDHPIDLSTIREGERVVIRVADRGPGVPEEERDRIFQPFYRRAGTQPDVGGTGLGLSIARRVAEAQGGTLECVPRPGGGSVFVFSLPAAELPTTLD
jgi:two-component system sensor histidine kinase KdpD